VKQEAIQPLIATWLTLRDIITNLLLRLHGLEWSAKPVTICWTCGT